MDALFSNYPATQLSRAEYLSALHPGSVLLEEFIKPLSLTVPQLAHRTGISVALVRGIVRGESPVRAATALRLSAHLGTLPEFWLNLQSRYDLLRARDAVADEIKQISLHPAVEAALQAA